MQLKLARVGKKVGAETWLHPLDLALRESAVTVLLGVTRAGKTSLMRLMAGLDVPTTGRVLVDDVDVTGLPVRHRNVAMVYQQFINYPSMTVAANIASPLRLRGEADFMPRVREIARALHIEEFLDRLPSELSGGQQQRVALARALAKDAPLMLLDEPLVNLDYKLREELREELGALFDQGRSTVVYATTEPGEALLLGGYTAVLDQGELRLVVPDLVLFEVLRGFRHPRELRQATLLMQSLAIEPTGSEALAMAAVDHYRSLRAQVAQATERSLQILRDLELDVFCEPSGCFYLWVYLHPGDHEERLVREASERSIFIAPGRLFMPDRTSMRPAMRLNIAYAAHPKFIEFMRHRGR